MTEEQIKKSLATNHLTLGFWSWLNHYSIAGLFALGAVASLFLIFTELLDIPPGLGELSFSSLIICFTICFALSVAFGVLQYKRLKLEFLSPPSNSYLIALQLKKLCDRHSWHITEINNQSIRIITRGSLVSWGEQIMLLFGQQGIYINCMATREGRQTLFTFGIRRENIELIRQEINDQTLDKDPHQ